MKINLSQLVYPMKPLVPSKPNRIWDFYKDGVTQSFIDKYLTCKLQCYLEYVEGWTPIREDYNLIFGTLLHEAIATSLKHGGDATEQFLASDPLKETLANDPQTKSLFYTQIEVLMGAYWLIYADDFSQEWKQIEKPFRTGCVVPLRGVIDGAYFNANGQYWLTDTKGLSVITTDNLNSTLPYDLQVLFYLYSEFLSGREPSGLVYNIIRKPGIKTTPVETYKDRLASAIGADMAHYFIRMPIQLKKSEVMYWADTVLEPILKEIEEWHNNDFMPRYANPVALLTKYHKLCTTFPIITRRDYSNFYQRTTVFREIKE